MNRRRIFLVVAVVVALMGTALVFLYVRGADQRAESRFETVEVLRATQAIEAGESIDDAAAAGKIAMQPVVSDYLQQGYQTSLDSLSGQYASVAIYPGEQIVSEKFSETVDIEPSLSIPKGKVAVSVNLTDPARVSGFVEPGTRVAIFYTGVPDGANGLSRLLLEEVEVIGVGSTSTTQKTTTTAEGEQTTEELPKTLMTIAVDKEEAEKILFGQANGELAFGLLTDQSTVNPGPGVTAESLFQ